MRDISLGKARDVLISGITCFLSVKVLPSLSMLHQVEKAKKFLTTGSFDNFIEKNKNCVIIAQLDINSLKNKFVFLSSQIGKYVEKY